MKVTFEITPEEVKELFGEAVVCRFRDLDADADDENEEELSPAQIKFVNAVLDAAKEFSEQRKD